MSQEKVYHGNRLFTLVFLSLGIKCLFFNAVASDMTTGIISVKENCHMSHIKTNL